MVFLRQTFYTAWILLNFALRDFYIARILLNNLKLKVLDFWYSNLYVELRLNFCLWFLFSLFQIFKSKNLKLNWNARNFPNQGGEKSGSYLGSENEEGRINEKKMLPAVGRLEIGDR